jgi:hypothetical protein
VYCSPPTRHSEQLLTYHMELLALASKWYHLVLLACFSQFRCFLFRTFSCIFL